MGVALQPRPAPGITDPTRSDNYTPTRRAARHLPEHIVTGRQLVAEHLRAPSRLNGGGRFDPRRVEFISQI